MFVEIFVKEPFISKFEEKVGERVKSLLGEAVADKKEEVLIGKRELLGAAEGPRDGICPARLTIYDSLGVCPRVVELTAESWGEFVNLLSVKTYQFSQEKGGAVPFTVIKEVVENLVHARFNEVIIAIFEDGNTIRIADQGPGINDKEKAFLPGFSTASAAMKKVIRGVGSGLPLAKEALSLVGGAILLEDNLRGGTVVTLKVPPKIEETPTKQPSGERELSVSLTGRQKRVVALVVELGLVGPSRVAEELKISPSSAYRDLLSLEKAGLVQTDAQGKRSLTAEGTDCLDAVLTQP